MPRANAKGPLMRNARKASFLNPSSVIIFRKIAMFQVLGFAQGAYPHLSKHSPYYSGASELDRALTSHRTSHRTAVTVPQT